jgi:hypothetical protein
LDDQDAIDNHFLHRYYSNRKLPSFEDDMFSLPELAPWKPSVQQCAQAYSRGEYAITIPCLTAAFEATLRRLGPEANYFSNEMEKLCRNEYKRLKSENDDLDVYIWLSLYAFVRRYYKHFSLTSGTPDQLYRHGIQHGTQAPPDERIESLRLFHALHTAAILCRDRSKSRRRSEKPSKP